MISFLTFAYNEGKYIEEAILSVLCIKDNIEYVLIDDNSNDNTWEVMQKYAAFDSRVKAYRNTQKGKNSALNCGITHCSGDWVFILAGDDTFENSSYRLFVDRLEGVDPSSSQVFVGGLVRRFADNLRYSNEDGVLNAFPKKGERRACTIGFASRCLVDALYPIPESYPNEDSWASMYYYYFCDELIYVPETCLNYRIHDNNSINHNDVDFKRFSAALHVRSNQQKDFVDKYYDKLKPQDIEYLINQYKAEDYRYRKKYLLLMLTNISLMEKLRMLLNSNRNLKAFKYRLTNLAQYHG